MSNSQQAPQIPNVSGGGNPTEFQNLPPEILILVLKSLPNFAALHSMTLSNRILHSIWVSNQYTICEGIVKKILGAVWPDALDLLRFQSGLKRDSEVEIGIGNLYGDAPETVIDRGILEGGSGIGLAEVNQLLKYSGKIAHWVSAITHVEVQTSPGRWGLRLISAEEKAKFTRAFYYYWIILLAGAPHFITFRDQFEWAKKKREEIAFILNEFHTEEEEIKETCLDSFNEIHPYLNYQRDVLGYLKAISVIDGIQDFPGSADDGGAHYYPAWVDEELLRIEAFGFIEHADYLARRAEERNE